MGLKAARKNMMRVPERVREREKREKEIRERKR